MFHQRKHIRLREFDYSSPNAYFITVCVKYFEPVLGTVRNGICGLSAIGNETAIRLQHIPVANPCVILDEFIVMPNHFHVLLIITKHAGAYKGNQFQKPKSGSVSMLINATKVATTKWCRLNGYRLEWQEKFYDHVIRNEEEYWAIKNYISNNPSNWQTDEFHS